MRCRMANFRLHSIGQLARQLAFTPHETREAQLAAAEQLLHLIDPAKAYPIDFVIYRITGYHPKAAEQDRSRPGSARRCRSA